MRRSCSLRQSSGRVRPDSKPARSRLTTSAADGCCSVIASSTLAAPVPSPYPHRSSGARGPGCQPVDLPLVRAGRRRAWSGIAGWRRSPEEWPWRVVVVAGGVWLAGRDDSSSPSASSGTKPGRQSTTSGVARAAASTTTTPATTGATGTLVLDPTKNYGNEYADGILPVGDGKYVTDGAQAGLRVRVPRARPVAVARSPAARGSSTTTPSTTSTRRSRCRAR